MTPAALGSATPMRPGWLVRIRRTEDGPVVGAGFLVTDRHIATCAHVVTDIRGAEPPEPVWVEFQYTSAHAPIAARITDGGWHPEDPTYPALGDVAILSLDGELPEGAAAAPLRPADSVAGHRAVAIGYPQDHPTDPVPALLTIAGAGEAEWLALQSRSVVGQGIDEGFSGSPVWDEDLEGVIGMTVTKDEARVDRRTAFAIPTDVLARYWPPLRRHVVPTLTGHDRDRLESLLQISLRPDGWLPRVADVRMYDIGVQRHGPDAAYVPRPEVDSRILAALEEQQFVLLVGGSGVGKSRTMIEMLRASMGDARLIVPLSESDSLAEVVRLALGHGSGPAVVWLDELNQYLGRGGLNVKTLGKLAAHDPPVTVVATMDADVYGDIQAKAGTIRSYARGVLSQVHPIVLTERLEQQERAADELARRFASLQRQGGPTWALVRAAADWNRVGLRGPVPDHALRTLFEAYLPASERREAVWAAAVAEACQTGSGAALLQDVGPHAYQVHSHVRAMVDGGDGAQAAPIPPQAWQHALDVATSSDLLGVAYAAASRDEGPIARRAAAKVRAQGPADPAAAAWATLFLAELDFADDDLPSASALFEQALTSPVADVAELARLDFGLTLLRLGDEARAESLLRDALLTDDASVASVAGAHLAHLKISSPQTQRAMLSHDRGEQPLSDDRPHELVRGTVERRQHDLMRPMAQAMLGGILLKKGELDDARRLLEQSLASGVSEIVPLAQANLGTLMCYADETAEGRRLLELAYHSDDAEAVALARVNLAWFLGQAGDTDRASELLSEAAEAEHPEQSPRAADLLGDLLAANGDLPNARAAYEHAIRSGHRDWAPIAMIDLAALNARHGDTAHAVDLLRQVGELRHEQLSPRAVYILGELLANDGQLDAAKAAYQEVIDSPHPEYSGLARIALAILQIEDDAGLTETLLTEATQTADRQVAAMAELMLALLYAEDDREEQAQTIFARLTADGDHEVALLAIFVQAALAMWRDDLDEAERHLVRLVEDPRAADTGLDRAAGIDLATLQLAQGDTDKAIETLQLCFDATHSEYLVDLLLDRGVELTAADRALDALPFLRAAADAADADIALLATVRTHLGIALLAVGELDDARVELEYAYRHADEAAKALSGRYFGSVLLRLDLPEQARPILTEVAVGDSSSKAEAALLLGRLARAEKHDTEAEAWLTQARDASRGGDPDVYANAGLLLGEMYVRAGKPAEGLRILSELAAGAGTSRVRALDILGTIGEATTPRQLEAGPRQTGPALPPLSLTLSTLLGEIASAEGDADEAVHWFTLAARSDDVRLRARAQAGLAVVAQERSDAVPSGV
ncbi:tetratricopeptide repeat protein [Catellatospora sp. NPDC049111]|uniref:tetratricopeptide repeat protein n=1 Tax=Catellatospora sp. NPDC049111 TaxID=3155271 RepID=UPI0033F073EE